MTQIIDGKKISQEIKDELREQVAERVRAEGLDIFVGVLCALHLQDTHAHLELFEDADRALRRLLPHRFPVL